MQQEHYIYLCIRNCTGFIWKPSWSNKRIFQHFAVGTEENQKTSSRIENFTPGFLTRRLSDMSRDHCR